MKLYKGKGTVGYGYKPPVKKIYHNKNCSEDMGYINKNSDAYIKKVLEIKNYQNKNIDENNINELNEMIQLNKILEKKIKNLETNIELKQMEIKSLEEIIERRKSNNNKEDNIKKLERDKEKLLMDNIKLVQQNKILQQMINEDKLSDSLNNIN